MEATLRQTLYWPTLRQDVHDLVSTCEKCQRCKKQQKKYGKLPAKVAESSIPWNRVCIDMIGPYTIETTSGEKHQLRCLTMIDPATGWFEIKALKRATAEAAMEAFDDVWLSRYPRPEYLGYDNGNEYKKEFDEMRRNYGMKAKQSVEYNPQRPGILRKMSTPRTGPHKVEAVYTNGTIRIRKGVVSERVNIRRVHPYRESE